MTTNFVPRDIFIRHEYEWQAVREAADGRIDLSDSERPFSPATANTKSAKEISPSAARSG
jgi:hypothetical protein